MFTGLIEDIGSVRSVTGWGEGARLSIETPLAAELAEGDSIAVEGVCLTVTSKTDRNFEADVSPETFERTTMSGWRAGTKVNLERATRAGERLGGHLVTGHVDGSGAVIRVIERGDSREMWLRAASPLPGAIVEKGSVAVDGVSLTVSNLSEQGFAVALIPETLRRTTLGAKRAGDVVNLETDMIGKYVQHYLEGQPARRVERRLFETTIEEGG